MRRGGVVGGAVVLALVLAAATSGLFGSGTSKTKTKTAAPPITLAPNPGQLTSAATAALNTVIPPDVSPACNAPPPASTAPATTIPAKGNAVATIAAPAGVPFPALDGSAPHYTKFAAAPPFCLDAAKTYSAVIGTDLGPITVQLLTANAPLTVNNFVFLAGYHYFDGIVFHRVIPGFVDQGGDPTATGGGSPGYTFADELPKSTEAYDTGALAMANSGVDTNGSQFFLVAEGGGKNLSKPGFSMFGQVTSGINIMTKINTDGSSSGTPTVLHRMTSVTIKVSGGPAGDSPTITAPPG